MYKHVSLIVASLILLPSLAQAGEVVKAKPGRSVERNMSSESPSTLWASDPERVETESGDEIAERDVLTLKAETVKLKNVVPPIQFELHRSAARRSREHATPRQRQTAHDRARR
jgi:hypothetical protein